MVHKIEAGWETFGEAGPCHDQPEGEGRVLETRRSGHFCNDQSTEHIIKDDVDLSDLLNRESASVLRLLNLYQEGYQDKFLLLELGNEIFYSFLFLTHPLGYNIFGKEIQNSDYPPPKKTKINLFIKMIFM